MLKLYAFRKINGSEVYEEITESKFLIDGYSFGDRLLEDVMFEVTFKDKQVISIECTKDSLDYFEDLNTKKWLNAGKEYVEWMLSNGGDEVMISSDIANKYKTDIAGICDESEV